VDDHWDLLECGKDKSAPWRQTVKMTLSRYCQLFENGYSTLNKRGYWKLRDGIRPYKGSQRISLNYVDKCPCYNLISKEMKEIEMVATSPEHVTEIIASSPEPPNYSFDLGNNTLAPELPSIYSYDHGNKNPILSLIGEIDRKVKMTGRIVEKTKTNLSIFNVNSENLLERDLERKCKILSPLNHNTCKTTGLSKISISFLTA